VSFVTLPKDLVGAEVEEKNEIRLWRDLMDVKLG